MLRLTTVMCVQATTRQLYFTNFYYCSTELQYCTTILYYSSTYYSCRWATAL